MKHSMYQNRIYIVGMGPGREEMMTAEARRALEQSEVIIGYTLYLKRRESRYPSYAAGMPGFMA